MNNLLLPNEPIFKTASPPESNRIKPDEKYTPDWRILHANFQSGIRLCLKCRVPFPQIEAMKSAWKLSRRGASMPWLLREFRVGPGGRDRCEQAIGLKL